MKNERKHPAIHYVVSLCLAIGLSLIPSTGTITGYGLLVLGVLIGVVYAWALNLKPWIAVILLIYYALRADVSFTASVFPSVIGNASLWTCIFCFAFVYGLQKSGLVEYLTTKLMRLPLVRKGPYALMFVICLTTYVTCSLTQATSAVFVLMLAMVKEYSRQMELPRYSSWTFMTAMGASVASLLAGTTLPFNSGVQLTLGVLSSFGIASPNFLWLALVSIAGFLCCTAAILLITKFILRPQISREVFRNLKTAQDESPIRMTRSMRLAMLDIVFMAAILAIPMLCPASWKFTHVISNLGVIGAFIAATVVLCFIRDEHGEPLFRMETDMQANTSWNILFFLGAILYFGSMFNAPETGIMAAISGVFHVGGVNPYLIAVLMCLGCLILTNAVNGLLAYMVFIPVILTLLAGADPRAQALAVIGCLLVCGFGFALPGGSFNGLVMHADKETYKFSQLCLGGFGISMLSGVLMILLVFLTCGKYYSGIVF